MLDLFDNPILLLPPALNGSWRPELNRILIVTMIILFSFCIQLFNGGYDINDSTEHDMFGRIIHVVSTDNSLTFSTSIMIPVAQMNLPS